MMVTRSMPRNIPRVSTSMRVSASHHTNKGVIMGARRVEAVVIPTENATSPLQRKDMMLLDTPPGQQPTSIMPMERYGLSPNACVRKYAMRGISVNCAHAPMRISHGLPSRMRKSSADRVSPIVSIITPRMTLDTSPLTHPNVPGNKYATKAAATT